MTDDKVMDRVKALLKLAERAGSDHEAELAREKAMALMLKHSIDEAMIQERPDHKREELISRTVKVKGYAKAKLYMMHRVAEGLGLKSLQYTNDRYGWSEGTGQVFGWESDVEAFDVLFASLMMQAETECARSIRENPYSEHGRSFKQSFLIAFAQRVGARLRQQRQQVIAETDISTPGTALAVVDRDRAVVSRWEQLHPDLGKGTGIRNSGAAGARAGRAAGDRANIGGSPSIGGVRKAIGR